MANSIWSAIGKTKLHDFLCLLTLTSVAAYLCAKTLQIVIRKRPNARVAHKFTNNFAFESSPLEFEIKIHTTHDIDERLNYILTRSTRSGQKYGSYKIIWN